MLDAISNATFQWERFADVVDEARPLMRSHHKAIHGGNFLPDLQRFHAMANSGVFKCATARRDGKLVGYAALLIAPMIHDTSKILATLDSLWLEPVERRGLLGYKFIKWFVMELIVAGVHKADFSIPINSRGASALLSRLGFEPCEISMRAELCPVAAA